MIDLPDKEYLSRLFSETDLTSDQVDLRTSLLFQVGTRPAHLRGFAVSHIGILHRLRITTSITAPTKALSVNLSSQKNSFGMVVATGGYVLISSNSPSDRFRVQLADDGRVFCDESGINAGQHVVFRLLRPGVHEIKDFISGAKCLVEVSYPLGFGQGLKNIDAASLDLQNLGFQPAMLTVLPSQAIRVGVSKRAKLTTKLIATTDLINGVLLTRARG